MTTLDPAMLKGTTLFAALTEDQSARLVSAGEVTTHAEGEMLTEEGARGHRFRLIVEGAAVVERAGKQLATLGPGDFMGEVSLLGSGIAVATVRCTKPTTCLTIWREAFWQALEDEPAIALRILEVVCRRLEQEFRMGPTANLEA